MTSILPTQRSSMLAHDFSMDMQTTFQMPDQLLDHRPIMPPEHGARRSYKTQTFSDGSEAKEDAGDASGNEAGDGNSSGTEGPSRKRRRSRKGLDKKFLCPQEGCGKSYSRAEHLYRHQLNHTPKQIFNCDFPGCTRTFVRQDLCNRHKDRHTAKGSQLLRKDGLLSHQTATPDVHQVSSSYNVPGDELGSQVPGIASRTIPIQFSAPPDMDTNGYALVTDVISGSFSTRRSSHGGDRYVGAEAFKRSNSESFPRGNESLTTGSGSRNARHSSFGVAEARPAELVQTSFHTPRLASPANTNMFAGPLMTSQGYVSSQNFTSFSMQPPTFTTHSTTPGNTENDMYPASAPIDYMKDSAHQQSSGPDIMLLEQMSEPLTLPVFGGVEYNRSPFAIPEDLVAYLFNGQQLDTSTQGAYGGRTNYADVPYSHPYIGSELSADEFCPTNPQQLHRTMTVTTLLDTSLPGSMISEEKSQVIVNIIRDRFTETGHALTTKKESILGGDRSDDGHMLSRRMMQLYIGSYWYHFSEQLPILHKPTFVPDEAPDLLLIAIMAIGAAGLPTTHGQSVTQAGVELSNFLAWHLRWEIFRHDHFRPPAKLWVFQALLLLELYEKMFSTRALHERAHIHHATTITLMRRGSSLIGKSALDSPPSIRDERHGPGSSRHSSASASASLTPNDWWNHWVINEATRRAAFAAFVLDSTHATMFGHSTVMVAHEMRLPLPCDDTLWYATNGAEVGRMEANLHASGVKPISFLEGLKRTLNAQEVRTNTFGRTILMAGLLSVSWHMNQRDLQVNSLGVAQALGGRDKWRGSLTRAFDLWKQDFDRSLVRQTDSIPGPYLFTERKSESAAFQSRIVLHHLAHMAMHVDVVDCQIFARAKRLLGRSIGPQDVQCAQRRMKEVWAPTAKARDATWYALRFLRTVLVPDEDAATMHAQSSHADTTFDYSARDDILLNRPWVMYFAALIVWAYGYALEGPTTVPLPATYSFDDQVRDMRSYLRSLGGVGSPEELKSLRGFNGCTGMLMVLRKCFENTRWELLHEAANLLGNCLALIKGTL